MEAHSASENEAIFKILVREKVEIKEWGGEYSVSEQNISFSRRLCSMEFVRWLVTD